MSVNLRFVWSLVPGVFVALLYGALTHYLFGSVLEGVTSTLSLAFIVIVPFVVGMLAVYFAPRDARAAWQPSLGIAVSSMLVGGVLAGALLWEAAICVAMALPIMLTMAAGGGLLMWWLLARRDKSGTSLLALFLLVPFAFIPLERQFPLQDSFHTVENQITINADAETVWQNIIRVAPIQDDERPFTVLFSWFDAPKPMQAEMSGEGVGGIRRGKFEGGLQFIETISMWEPAQRIEWDITPDNAKVMRAPWSGIGGKAFAVPHAAYWIEQAGAGQVVLHLSSTHRLTTRFNGYGGLWTQWGMSEFQKYILTIIKARAERAAGS